MSRAVAPHNTAPWENGHLRVSADGHHVLHSNGIPFFWLGDTAWELFRRLSREQVKTYLADRSSKGFNVIQAVAIMGYRDGLDLPNAEGNLPLVDYDPTRPDVKPETQNDYWDLVDFTIDQAAECGLYVALLPTWGCYVSGRDRTERRKIFDTNKIRIYGTWIAERYKARPNIIWVNGGDCPPDKGVEEWQALGTALRAVDPDRLITFHPCGGRSSSTPFHAEPWLDANMCQSGHGIRKHSDENFRMISADYTRSPAKPVVDGEPCYEGLPKNVHLDPALGYWLDRDVRRKAYWSVFAGAFGFTYGHNSVHLFFTLEDEWRQDAEIGWEEALQAPGASQMVHLKALMQSRPPLSRGPNQAIVPDNPDTGYEHLRATSGDGYAFVYAAIGRPFEIDMTKVPGEAINAWWYNPRTGEATDLGERRGGGTQTFDPPGAPEYGNDWVLVLDDAAMHYPPPGRDTK